MLDFSEVIEQLSGEGFTASEAVQAAAALSQIPQIELLLDSSLGPELIVKALVKGFAPMRKQQEALAKGVASFSHRERQCYFKHTLEGKSFTEIGRELNVCKSSVQLYITRARKKLYNAAN